MPSSPRRRSSGGRKKVVLESGGSPAENSLHFFEPPVTCSTCGDSFVCLITPDQDLELSCGCNGTKLIYQKV
jgi:hypothetical protein